MSVENLSGEQLAGWSGFINNLTVRKIFLTVLLAVGLALAYGLYDQKATVIDALTHNPTFLVALIGGGVLIALGMTFTSLQTRIDDKSKELHNELRMRLADQARSHKEAMEALQSQFDEINEKERTCHENYHQLTLQLAKKGFFKDSDHA